MAISTYTTLKNAISSWTWNSEAAFVAASPDFISLGEAYIYRNLRCREMESRATLTTAAGTATTNLPNRYRAAKSLYIDSDPDRPLELLGNEEFNIRFAGSEQGKPTHFCIEGETFRFGPTPDATYSIICYYWQALQSLSVSVTTNNLLSKHPDLYLQAALVHAWAWLQDEQRSMKAQKEVDRIIAEIERHNKWDRFSGSQLVMRNRGSNP